jgi:hypothetical protein
MYIIFKLDPSLSINSHASHFIWTCVTTCMGCDMPTSTSSMGSLQKLTALSTHTLSLLLERQRLQTLPSPGTTVSTSLHLPQITRNLRELRAGIRALEEAETVDATNGNHGTTTEATRLLRSQYERMRGMLGGDGHELERSVQLSCIMNYYIFLRVLIFVRFLIQVWLSQHQRQYQH